MAAEPTIWILSRGRKGDLDQMLALAKATGWPLGHTLGAPTLSKRGTVDRRWGVVINHERCPPPAITRTPSFSALTCAEKFWM